MKIGKNLVIMYYLINTNNFISFLIVVILSLPSLLGGQPTDQSQLMYPHLSDNGMMSTFNPKIQHYTFDDYMQILVERADDTWVTPALKPQVIQRLKTIQADASQPEDVQKRVLGCLAEMGDDAATATVLNNHSKPNDDLGIFYSICLRHATPAQQLPYHLDKVINGDPVNHNLVPSVMDRATNAAFLDICDSSLFPKKTRDWADNCFHFYRGGYLGHGRNCKGQMLLFSWWEHNKDAIKAGRYGDATWLPVMEDEATLRKEMLEGKTNSNEGSSISPDKPLIAQVAPDKSWRWPIVLSVLIAIILGGGFWLYRFQARTR